MGRISTTTFKAWSKIKAHPYWSFATIGGLALGLDAIGYLQIGVSMMEAFFGPDWLAQMLQNPLFKLACLTAAAFAFWRVGSLSVKEEQKSADVAKKTLDQAVDAIKSDNKLPNLIAGLHIISSELDADIDALTNADNLLCKCSSDLTSMKNHPFKFQDAEHSVSRLAEALQAVEKASIRMRIDASLPEIQMPSLNMPPEPDGYLASTRPFDPALNARFLSLYGEFLFDANAARGNVRKALNERINERAALLQKITTMAKN